MEIEQEVPRILAINKNKIGKFRVSREAVEKGYVAAILAYIKATPIYVEVMFHNDTIEYTIYSEILPSTAEGQVTPEYKFDIEMSAMGRIVGVNVLPI